MITSFFDDDQNRRDGQDREGTGSHDNQEGRHEVQPRQGRRPMTPPEKRGLAPDDELRRFVEAYLGQNRELYPELADSDLLPPPTSATVDRLVAEFKKRHAGNLTAAPGLVQRVRDLAPELQLAAAYARVSAAQSNPKSLLDQNSACIRRARANGRFIPIDYIYADHAWTGKYPKRRGYQSLKDLLADPEREIRACYFDDFNRCGRNLAEWGRFADTCKTLGIAVISVEQGIDFSDPTHAVMIPVFGMVSDFQLMSVRANVRRGIRGTIERGIFVGRAPFGYGLVIAYDHHGRVMTGARHKALRKLAVDPNTGPVFVEIFDRFANQGWPMKAIAEDLNKRAVEGWDRWHITAIKRILRSAIGLGVWVYGKQTRQFNIHADRYEVKRHSFDQVISVFDPDLQLISSDLWLRAQERLDAMRKKHPNTGRAPSRNQNCPTTLFSAALVCGYCGDELKLLRSAGIQQQMCCTRGRDRQSGCKLTTSKSVIAIEECLLGPITDSLLTDSQIDRLVELTNRVLAEEADKPLPDEKPLRQKERRLRTDIKRLNDRITECDDKDAAKSLVVTLGKHQRELDRLLPQLRAVDATVRLRMTRITREAVVEALQDVRGLLNQEKKVAGLAIRELTGPIRITQKRVPGTKNKSRWVAEFTPQLGGILRRVLDADDDAVRLIQDALPEADKVTVIIEPNFRKAKRKIEGRDEQGHLTPEGRAKIEELLRSGMSITDVCRAVDVGRTTVFLIRRALEESENQEGSQGAA